MAKIPVGGANGLIDQLLTLCGFRATTNTADPERKDALVALNFAERFIAGSDALLYLQRKWPVVLADAANVVAIPSAPAVDVGKDFILEDPDGFPLRYCALDEFMALNLSTYDCVRNGNPAGVMVIIDTDDVAKFEFKPRNTTGGALTFALRGQRAIVDLTDSNASFSLLPEGYEITLLLPIAEQYIKQRKYEIDTSMLDDQTQRALGSFYEKQRVNKKNATTDANLERRVSERQVTPGER